jgi:hypothetical protein
VCKFVDGQWRTLDCAYDSFIRGLSQPTHWTRLRGPVPAGLIDKPTSEAEELKVILRTIAVLVEHVRYRAARSDQKSERRPLPLKKHPRIGFNLDPLPTSSTPSDLIT